MQRLGQKPLAAVHNRPNGARGSTVRNRLRCTASGIPDYFTRDTPLAWVLRLDFVCSGSGCFGPPLPASRLSLPRGRFSYLVVSPN